MTDRRLHAVYAIVGSDRFLRGAALKELLDGAGDDMDAMGPTRVDGDGADAAAVLDEMRTPSLLGGRRLVIVDDADDFISANRAILERCCAASEGGCLILLCDSLPKNTKLYKIIADAGQVIACEPPKGRDVGLWIIRRAKETYGKRMSPEAARLLRDFIGDSPGWLDTELGKLTAYVGSRGEITPADVEASTGQSREEKVFAVVDALAAGDARGALRHWEQVWATDRAAPGRAIGGLAWSVRRMLQARREWEAGAELGMLARKMFTDPATLRRRFEYMSPGRLEQLQRGLLEADLAVKTGVSTVDVGIEKLIVGFAAQATIRAKAG
jgi:DNA polymerase-3 subunit delta